MISLNDVLLAMSNVPVDDPIAEIWGRGLQDGYKIIEYTGSLPITINANGDALIDYRIYGADGGVGEQTENLFDPNAKSVDNGYIARSVIGYPDGAITSGITWAYVTEYIPVDSSTNYIIFMNLYRATLASSIGLAFYDENKDFISATYGCRALREVTYENPSSGMRSFETPENCRYIRTNVDTLSTMLMLVAAPTPPPAYIPYGYKLPMTAYKQEFKVTNDMLNQSNWILSPPYGDYNQRYFMYFDISASISKEECDAKVYKNFTDGYVPEKLVVALTDDIYPTVDTIYRILNNNGRILNKKFDFSSWNKIYLCIGYGNGFMSNDTKQLKIDELFGNWEILIAPVSQTQTVPVYIGENQMAENEYVSYSEQKIYRDVGGTLTPTDPPVSLPEIPTIKGETIIDYDGTPKPSQMYVKYKGNG